MKSSRPALANATSIRFLSSESPKEEIKSSISTEDLTAKDQLPFINTISKKTLPESLPPQDWQFLFREAVAKEAALLKTSLQNTCVCQIPRLTQTQLYEKMKRKEETQQDRIQYLAEDIYMLLRIAILCYCLAYFAQIGAFSHVISEIVAWFEAV